MKRLVYIILAALASIIFIMSLSSCSDNEKVDCIFFPEICELMFECSPEEFFEEENEYSRFVGDLRDCAKIDESNNLIVSMNKKQRKFLRQQWDMNTKLYISDNPYLNVSYTDNTIIVYGYQNAEYDESFILSYAYSSYTAIIYQVLNGVSADEITLKCIVKDGVTGEVFYSATYPEDEIELSFGDYNFSPLPE